MRDTHLISQVLSLISHISSLISHLFLMKPTLIILAAGMGSRYGGLKQMDEVGPNGEAIIDYSLFDAIRAGFGKVVFVIRTDFAEAFKSRFDPRLKGKIAVEYVYQSLDKIPAGFTLSPEKTKAMGHSSRPLDGRRVCHRGYGCNQCRRFLRKESIPGDV